MDINILRGISTGLLLIIFIGYCFWAYSSKRKKAFNEAELLPFDEKTVKQIKENRGETENE